VSWNDLVTLVGGWFSAPASWSVLIATCALVISIWTKLGVNREIRMRWKIEQIRRLGEAFVAAQKAKNKLSECESLLAALISGAVAEGKSRETLEEMRSLRDTIEGRYQEVWEWVKNAEAVLGHFERGGDANLDLRNAEVKVARFNQLLALTEGDVHHVKSEEFKDSWERIDARIKAMRALNESCFEGTTQEGGVTRWAGESSSHALG